MNTAAVNTGCSQQIYSQYQLLEIHLTLKELSRVSQPIALLFHVAAGRYETEIRIDKMVKMQPARAEEDKEFHFLMPPSVFVGCVGYMRYWLIGGFNELILVQYYV